MIVMGEDVDRGVFGVTRGLIDTFGANRIRKTPISEAAFVGGAVGAAAAGLRPFAHVMFSSFFYVAMDQVANQAARLRYMSGGQVELPIVYFAGTGPSGSAAAQHSENPHSILMHTAGLKVVMPSTPYDAKGLMIAAIRDPNPVVYLADLRLARRRESGPEGSLRDPARRGGCQAGGRRRDGRGAGFAGPHGRRRGGQARGRGDLGRGGRSAQPRTARLGHDRRLGPQDRAAGGRRPGSPPVRGWRRRSSPEYRRGPGTPCGPSRAGSPGRTYPFRSVPCSREGST